MKTIINYIIIIVVWIILMTGIEALTGPRCYQKFGIAITLGTWDGTGSDWRWDLEHITPIVLEFCDDEVTTIKRFHIYD